MPSELLPMALVLVRLLAETEGLRASFDGRCHVLSSYSEQSDELRSDAEQVRERSETIPTGLMRDEPAAALLQAMTDEVEGILMTNGSGGSASLP